MKIKLLGIDLAKNVFQICALSQANKVLFNRTIRRARFHSSIAKLEPTSIAMEACSSAHYWGRAFEAMGHSVLLVPAQHVTPFVRGGKSDASMHWLSAKPHSGRGCIRPISTYYHCRVSDQ